MVQLSYSHTSSLSSNDNLLCKDIFLAGTNISLQLDVSQHKYSNCICFGDETGRQRIWNPATKACIPVFNDTDTSIASLPSVKTSIRVMVDSVVNEGSARLWIRKGYYPCLSPCSLDEKSPIVNFTNWDLNQLLVLKCELADACNPDWDDPAFADLSNQDLSFQCSGGTEGFLCSKCQSGYFL